MEESDLKTQGRATLVAALTLFVLVCVFMQAGLFPRSGQMLGGEDTRGLFLPWVSLVRAALREGRLPLWDASTWGGYPFFANPQVGLFYPPAWLAFLLPVRFGLGAYAAFHLWLAGMGMWTLARRLTGSDWGAMLAALTFAFSGFAAARLYMGHLGLLATLAWLPWILVAYLWSARRGDLWTAIPAGVPVGLAVLAGHTSSLLYIGLIWLAFAVFHREATQRRRDAENGQTFAPLRLYTRVLSFLVERIRPLVISALVGALLSGVILLPFMELSALSGRQQGALEVYGARWSFPPFHLIALLIPGYFGVPGYTGWWSVDNFEELTYYVGLLPLLALAVAWRRPSRLTWLCLGLIVFGLLLAFGAYGFLYPLLYRLLPFFGLARAPARAAYLYLFAGSLLLAEVVARWEALAAEERQLLLCRAMPWVLAIIGLDGLLGLAATGAAFAVYHPSETGGRLWHQAGGWAWAWVGGLGGACLLWRFLATDSARKRRAFGLLLAAFLLADLWLFGYRLVKSQPAQLSDYWRDARQIIGETTQRVVPWATGLFIQNDASLAGLSSVLGYNTLDVVAYQRFIADLADPRMTVLDLLGVEYVLSPGTLEARFLEGERAPKLLGSAGAVRVYRRARVLPMARLVYQVEVIADAGQAKSRLNQPDFDPVATVILAQASPLEIGGGAGQAEVALHTPERWQIKTQSDAAAILVLSENAYPGWRVIIDGLPAESLTAYTTLRAVVVPAGEHVVEWRFQPRSLYIGAALSVLGLLLVGASLERQCVSQSDVHGSHRY
jgi:hypothetical protein